MDGFFLPLPLGPLRANFLFKGARQLIWSY